ncbi:MAG: carbamoyltransferase [Deltaproteobacteria bacterium]|nr:carbamoyltransferase [Deltaproteobacteria bacterium]
MNILGISCFYHDAAAALLREGRLVAAAHEERFTRKRHDPGLPRQATSYCLEAGGLDVGDLDYVVFYDKPFIKFERILTTYLATFPRSLPSFTRSIPIWLKEKLWVPRLIAQHLGYRGEVLFAEHHQSHAASAFLPSPFEEAAILTCDGVGEWATATQGVGRGNSFELQREVRFPHSLGLLYSALTYYLGFKVNSAEYKVMGAAPYGEPRFAQKMLDELIDLRDDGSFKLNMKYFAYDYGLTMTNRRFDKLFGEPRRQPEATMEQFHWDMAASVQKVTEEAVLRMVRDLHARTGMKNLCMAGGVALNCVANGRIIREGPFEDLWVQPAAGDAGGALGAALFAYNAVLGQPRSFRMDHAFWGPAYSDEAVRRYLDARGAPYRTLAREEMIEETARRLDEDQAVVGWFQGRLEWGPRALGSRSILADARNQENWKRVNLKIKFRESFRPFAPAVLAEKTSEWFEIDRESPYMLLVCQVRPGKKIPAITHVDGSARLQTVTRETHPEFYDLIAAFDRRTGCPVIINTSFNVRGEPIVCSPDDAYLCFMRTNMDVLVLGNQVLLKQEQPELHEDFDWRERYELD